MNKKISTLMAGGFLLTSVFASAQFTIDPADLDTVTTAELQKGGTFVILESTDKEISDDDRIFSANSGTYTYASCFLKTYDTYTDAAKDKILWNLAVSQREGDLGDQPSYYYTLQNVNTKSYLSFEGSTHLVVEDKVEAPLHGEKDGCHRRAEKPRKARGHRRHQKMPPCPGIGQAGHKQPGRRGSDLHRHSFPAYAAAKQMGDPGGNDRHGDEPDRNVVPAGVGCLKDKAHAPAAVPAEPVVAKADQRTARGQQQHEQRLCLPHRRTE